MYIKLRDMLQIGKVNTLMKHKSVKFQKKQDSLILKVIWKERREQKSTYLKNQINGEIHCKISRHKVKLQKLIGRGIST